LNDKRQNASDLKYYTQKPKSKQIYLIMWDDNNLMYKKKAVS